MFKQFCVVFALYTCSYLNASQKHEGPGSYSASHLTTALNTKSLRKYYRKLPKYQLLYSPHAQHETTRLLSSKQQASDTDKKNNVNNQHE